MGFCFQALIDGIAASSVAGMKFTTCVYLYILCTLVVLKVFIFLVKCFGIASIGTRVYKAAARHSCFV